MLVFCISATAGDARSAANKPDEHNNRVTTAAECLRTTVPRSRASVRPVKRHAQIHARATPASGRVCSHARDDVTERAHCASSAASTGTNIAIALIGRARVLTPTLSSRETRVVCHPPFIANSAWRRYRSQIFIPTGGAGTGLCQTKPH